MMREQQGHSARDPDRWATSFLSPSPRVVQLNLDPSFSKSALRGPPRGPCGPGNCCAHRIHEGCASQLCVLQIPSGLGHQRPGLGSGPSITAVLLSNFFRYTKMVCPRFLQLERRRSERITKLLGEGESFDLDTRVPF